MANPADAPAIEARARGEGNTAVRWAVFVAFGLLLYALLYAWSERLVLEHGDSNRFFQIATTSQRHHDVVILGASHAMPLGYGEMEGTLEETSGRSIMNLSVEGGGVLPAHLLLDYYLEEHSTDRVLVFIDSFTFLSPQWNETRVQDPDLFRRAPLDPALAAALWRNDFARPMLPWYLSGFHKVNDDARFEADMAEGEAKFDSTYRPIAQIDRRRVEYLYPPELDREALATYLGAFDELIARAEAAGASVVALKPPTPDRYRDLLPYEAEFDAALGGFLERRGVMLRDFSESVEGDEFYYDTDHLNRAGVERFAEVGLAELLSGD